LNIGVKSTLKNVNFASEKSSLNLVSVKRRRIAYSNEGLRGMELKISIFLPGMHSKVAKSGAGEGGGFRTVA